MFMLIGGSKLLLSMHRCMEVAQAIRRLDFSVNKMLNSTKKAI